MQLEARPLLIDVPREGLENAIEVPQLSAGVRETFRRGEILVDAVSGAFVLPIRNVGRGAAIIETVTFELPTANARHTGTLGQTLAAGEDLYLRNTPAPGGAIARALAKVPSPAHHATPYRFFVEYTDAQAGQRQILRLDVGTAEENTRLLVKGVLSSSL